MERTRETEREREKIARGNFGEMRRSGWVQTGHVKRNESRSRTWLGRDPRYPDHRSRSASFLCREFKLDTTTLHPQPVKLAPRLPNHPGEILLYFTALYSTAPRSSSSYLKRILKFPLQKLSRRAYKNSIGDLTRLPFRMLQIFSVCIVGTLIIGRRCCIYTWHLLYTRLLSLSLSFT